MLTKLGSISHINTITQIESTSESANNNGTDYLGTLPSVPLRIVKRGHI